jgi:hypothetical protein
MPLASRRRTIREIARARYGALVSGRKKMEISPGEISMGEVARGWAACAELRVDHAEGPLLTRWRTCRRAGRGELLRQ